MGKHYDFLHSLIGIVKDTQNSIPTKMSHLEKDVEFGVKDYDSLENIPVKNVSSSSDAMVYLRDLDSGVYRLSGYFQPFEGSGISCSFSSNQLVNVVKKTAGSHIQIFYPVNNVVQFVSIMVDENADGGYTYERNDIKLNDLKELISVVGSLDGLETDDKTSIVAAINEIAGNMSSDGTIISQNADYAEVGEWADGNPSSEDRIGYFVAVDTSEPGKTMVKATSDSDVRGVTMKQPAFAANASEDKYDIEGNLLPQFDYVCFAGFAPVIDNGTCTVNGRCMPADDGTAKPSTNNLGYQVIERIDDTHVLVLVEPQADMMVRIKEDISQLSEEKVALPKDDDGNVNSGTVGWYAVSDGAGGITWDESAPGKDGKTAYQYAQDAGYAGTEQEFAEKLAADIPIVDDTLNVLGQAADAKVTGDLLSRAAPGIIVSADGETISLEDSSDKPLQGLFIYGRTTQDGTPTLEAPVELVSVGNSGSIGVAVTDGADDIQSLIVPTPNGLPGIPVSSGGNYTDADGQQWWCDTVNFETGEYEHRTIAVTFDNTQTLVTYNTSTSDICLRLWYDIGQFERFGTYDVIANRMGTGQTYSRNGIYIAPGNSTSSKYVIALTLEKSVVGSTAAEARAWIAANPIDVIVGRTDIVTEPLDAETIAAYAAMHTNKPNTTINNDAGAHMTVQYVADTKQYVDNVPAMLAKEIPEVDATLTKSGQAADAAVVGTRLDSLSEDITDCIPVPASAEVGQTIVVKAVDENGKPTAWEPVDMPEQAQSDWNQNESTAADYVKNRPFWEDDPAETVIIEEQTHTIGSDLYSKLNASVTFEEGVNYTVTINGVEYKCVAKYGKMWDYYYIGNGNICDETTEDTQPFCIASDTDGAVFLYTTETGEYTLFVSGIVSEVHTIDEKYIPKLPKNKILNYDTFCCNYNNFFTSYRHETILSDGSLVYSCPPEVNFYELPDFGIMDFAGIGLAKCWSVYYTYASISCTTVLESGIYVNGYLFVHSDNIEQGIADYKNDYGIE